MTFLIFHVSTYPTSFVSPPNKSVILSEALRRFIANKGFMARSRRTSAIFVSRCCSGFSGRRLQRSKKSQALSGALHNLISRLRPLGARGRRISARHCLSMRLGDFQPPKPGNRTFLCNTHSRWVVRMRWRKSFRQHRQIKRRRGPSTTRHKAFVCDKSAKRFAQDDGFVGGVKQSWLGRLKHERSKKSQALRMTSLWGSLADSGWICRKRRKSHRLRPEQTGASDLPVHRTFRRSVFNRAQPSANSN